MSRFEIKESYFKGLDDIQYYNIFDTHFDEMYEPEIHMLRGEALKVIYFLNVLCGEEYHRGFQDGIMDMKGKLNDLIDMKEKNYDG